MAGESKCPMGFGGSTHQVEEQVPKVLDKPVAGGGAAVQDWWPNNLKLNLLHQHSPAANPLGPSFDYAAAFNQLDLGAVKADLRDLMTDSQDWWPADWGHYGPFFIRMAWHSAGTYRVGDGRGGACSANQRFAPVNSWPDNGNLDKARRLLLPLKLKYGARLSWADLIILAGNVALESMGVHTFGYAGGREDIFEPEEDIYWGPEFEWLGDKRYADPADRSSLQPPLAAVQMGWIYVNPEGPNGKPDPATSAHDIRETFARMAMDDDETVALVAGGHTFGKAHGAGSGDVGEPPEGAAIEEQGFGWKSGFGTGRGADTVTSGIEGAWKPNPLTWDMGYLATLLKYEWELETSPAGAKQWRPKNCAPEDMVADAHGSTRHRPMMTTADMGLRVDDKYRAICERYLANPSDFADAFARAWYKLTHRDLGPKSRLLGPEVPEETPPWQDPVPPRAGPLISPVEIAALKRAILDSGMTVGELVSTAWASASTFRGSDKRGGANGGRIRLAPQRGWEINHPKQLDETLKVYEKLQSQFSGKVSMADLIVLGGCVGVEEAARRGGVPIEVPFIPGRTDASQEQTDIDSMAVLEPRYDAFRNYLANDLPSSVSPEELMVDKAQLLTLSAPEMAVLVAGMRVLNTNYQHSTLGMFTDRPGVLTNDFFVNLLDMRTTWETNPEADGVFIGRDRSSGKEKWQGSRVDLIFGSNSQLRALAEVYGSSDAAAKFVADFVSAWSKVMNLDRFDVATAQRVAQRGRAYSPDDVTPSTSSSLPPEKKNLFSRLCPRCVKVHVDDIGTN
mmetsp:Transcript_12580/g.32282  ORF Transcript_12580/g.32282 Transcript_12580/m.32282 type:complete len:793 (-) Transcript_12580:114-2492(-)